MLGMLSQWNISSTVKYSGSCLIRAQRCKETAHCKGVFLETESVNIGTNDFDARKFVYCHRVFVILELVVSRTESEFIVVNYFGAKREMSMEKNRKYILWS